MLKKQLIIFKIVLIYFLNLTISHADLVKPNSGIKPNQVIKMQLKSLKYNDRPSKDNGINQVWEFAHPNNKKNTGPLTKFSKMIKGKSYKVLLNHLDHKIIQLKLTKSIALYEVIILDEKKLYFKFNWQVEKYIKDGPLKNCWLTVMVSSPVSLGSSI